MNSLYNNCVKKYNKNIKNITYNKNSIIFDSDNKYVAKNINDNLINNYEYLIARGFNYIPDIIYHNDNGYIYRYIDNLNVPIENKAHDLIKLMSLLHNKTVYYKNISKDEIKEYYEYISNLINDTYLYYDDIVTMIENIEYYSPSQYLLIRNSSALFSALNFSKEKLEAWYEKTEETQKKRVALLHNNIDLEHIIINENKYLISWDNSKYENPIYDFLCFYNKNYDILDFDFLYKEYNKLFQLLKEEIDLLFCLMFIPKKEYFGDCEMTNTINFSKLFNYLFTSNKLFMENYAEYGDEKNHDVNKK